MNAQLQKTSAQRALTAQGTTTQAIHHPVLAVEVAEAADWQVAEVAAAE